MTKDKIIIDDINVADCIHYINSTHLDYNCGETPKSCYCKNKSNCYYKQLQKTIAVKDDYYFKLLEYERLMSDLITALEDVREIVKSDCDNTLLKYVILNKIGEVLNG